MKNFTDLVSLQIAKFRRLTESKRMLRLLSSRTATTLALGCALSIGGATEALQGVHFLVSKDLDAVRVVKQDSGSSEVVAKLTDGFAGNSLFKLSRVLPESFVSHQIGLFNEAWLPTEAPAVQATKGDVFHTEMARINTAIRRQFFANAVPFGDIIHEKAQKYDVDPALVAAVVETESRFHPQARSQVGARGLMQLMPRTGRWLGASNLNDPEQNVDAGVKYLKYLQNRFDGNLVKAVAAYNGGEGNVKRYNGVPPFHETRSYVKKVMTKYHQRSKELKDYAASTDAVDGVVTLR